jgi:ABC-type transporter Mla subunit MlaD
MNEPYRLRYTNQIVGVFLLVLLVLIAIVGFSVTRAGRLFVTPLRYYVQLSDKDAEDLTTDTEVVVLGKPIGSIESIQYIDHSDQIRITLAIDPLYRDLITTESVLAVERKFGLGKTVIKIRRRHQADSSADSSVNLDNERPSVTATPLIPGATILQVEGKEDRLAQIANKVDTTGDSIDVAAKSVDRSFEKSVNPAADRVKIASESVEKTSETVRPDTILTLEVIRQSTSRLESQVSDLTKALQQVVEVEMRRTLNSIENSARASERTAATIEQTSSTIGSNTEKTQSDIAETLELLRQSIVSIQSLTNESREVVRIVRGEANQLPGTTQRINETVSDTQDLVNEVQDHWFLSGRDRKNSRTPQLSPSSTIRSGGTR